MIGFIGFVVGYTESAHEDHNTVSTIMAGGAVEAVIWSILALLAIIVPSFGLEGIGALFDITAVAGGLFAVFAAAFSGLISGGIGATVGVSAKRVYDRFIEH